MGENTERALGEKSGCQKGDFEKPYSIIGKKEPVFITKNGYGDLVVMSMETYESMLETAETDAAISEAETEYTQDGLLHDARNAFDSLRRKHFG